MKNQFIYRIILVYTIYYLSIIFFDPFIFDNYIILFTILIFGPIIPLWYAENRWQGSTSNELSLQYQKVKSLRIDFLSIGILGSIIFIIISQVTTLAMGSEYYWQQIRNVPFFAYTYTIIGNNRMVPSFLLMSIYLLLLSIVSFITSYKLILTRYNGPDELRNRVFNHPGVSLTLMLYFFLGSMITLPVLYAFQNISILENALAFRSLSENPYYIFTYFVFANSLPTMIIIPFFLTIQIPLYLGFLPYVLRGRNIELKKVGKKLQDLILISIIVPIGVVIAWYNMFLSGDSDPTENLYSVNLLIIIIIISTLIYRVRQSFPDETQCQNCGYFGGEDCEYCENNSRVGTYEVTGFNLEIPKCPNCKSNWDNLSRRCSNCKYTIVLTCENCSQTINPLWKKCNLCGTPRLPVPEIALTKPKDERVTYTRATLMIWLIMTLPVLITDVIIYFAQVTYLNSRPPTELNSFRPDLFFYDNYRRWVIWALFALTIIFLVIKSLDTANKQRLILTKGIMRIMYSELYIFVFINLLMLIIVDIGFGIFFLIVFSILIAILGGIYFRRYKKMLEFDPYSIHIPIDRREN